MRFDTITGNDIWHNALHDFEATALALYQYQYQQNELYRSYHELLRIEAHSITQLEQIPFLPISFFKTHQILSNNNNPNPIVFESSGTTAMIPSRHFVSDLDLYDTIALAGFEAMYGSVKDWVILALLPSYLERQHSSLVHMAKMLMDRSNHPDNGFYLHDLGALSDKLIKLKHTDKKILLLGVTFALLDFAEAYPMDLNGVVVMETGGMKGRKEEWTRKEVQDFLKTRWSLMDVHSEYGMTELLSQAYARSEGVFKPIPTMRAFVRDLNDPLETQAAGTGCLNIIDLANVHSVAFIATEDMAKINIDGSFEVLGRMDFAALRGCSLMLT